MDREKAKVLEKIEAAKRMVTIKDYTGARSNLLEVNYQFPGLKNVPQMITACDILCSSELTIDGEPDWYWILQLSPEATADQLRLRYNRLVAILEGIKDDFSGALTALKLVHDASAVLSSASKSWIFNSNRLTSRSISESFVSTLSSLGHTGQHNGSSLSQEQDSSRVCESSASKDSDAVEGILGVDEKSLKPIEIDDSADADYTNQCNKAINSTVMLEENHNAENFGLPNDKPSLNLTATIGPVSDEVFYNFDASTKAEAIEVGQIWAAYDGEKFPRRYARINYFSESPFRLDVTWLKPIPRTENEIKWCEVGLPVVCGLFDLHEDEESLVDSDTFSHLVSCTTSPTYDEFEIYPQEDEVWAVYKDWKPIYWLENPEARKGCSLQIVQILEGYSEQVGIVVVPLVKDDGTPNIFKRESEVGQECSFIIPATHLYQFSHQLPAHKLEDGKLVRVSSGIPTQGFSLINSSTSKGPTASCPTTLRSMCNTSLKVEWTSEDFAADQVWAMYDNSDQMPRQYAVVNKVFNGEAVEVTFLEPQPNPIDVEEISWIEENLPIGCGTFKRGTRIAILQLNKFSHLVNCDRSTRNMFFRIYPKKGEIWAMFRNWSKKWKQQDFVNHHCQIVEITSDFTEAGLETANLEEVPGYKTFFQKQLCDGYASNQVVPKSDMLSFSHRIEAYVVPGSKAYGIPDWSWHLEPDALPPLLSNG